MSDDSSRRYNSVGIGSPKARFRTFQIGDEAGKSKEMVPWTGVEPVTLRLGGGCSIQLSYQGVNAILTE